ncbi:AIM24 family protein [Anaerosacchariphilus polymeriproducens]|uniref:AIM24 family protein n=1 Tax=Anaerosacchariphilus polymeriproducens TaxID=1812858 RepID=A0A371ASV3_9FIRM|nr:AIM24 family protein [Anaerosacchariphilus polymeriproducens]RDU22641.1 AIM24 family protein [Anaerosacchariphilus polymeriproducens]
MFTCKNLFDNENIKIISQMGNIKVLEHQMDLSVLPGNAIDAYYSAKMNIRKRQVVIELNDNSYTLSSGSMQWTCGNIQMTSGIKGVGDFLGKALSAKVSKESAIKPEYKGTGLIMLEPTFKHILLENIADWDGLVLEDGLFLACDSTVKQTITARSNLSSAALGGEGLFNLCLQGNGVAVLESPVPREELIVFDLKDDELKIDGNMAIAWSKSLKFTVEKSSKSLVTSAVSGEGFVNVYRGTGKVLMAPTR